MYSRQSRSSSDPSSDTHRRKFLYLAGATLLVSPILGKLVFGKPQKKSRRRTSSDSSVAVRNVVKSDQEWRRLLTDEQYHILREAGTEPAYDNHYHDHKEKGSYACVACGNRLFLSSAKFDSGTGWPSFFQPIDSAAVDERPDNTLFSRRTEIICHRCEGHLGHVFDDGPQPTGLRYCMNSTALTFFAEKGSMAKQ